MSKDSIYDLIITIFFEKSSIVFKNEEIVTEKSGTMMTIAKVRVSNKLGGSNRK